MQSHKQNKHLLCEYKSKGSQIVSWHYKFILVFATSNLYKNMQRRTDHIQDILTPVVITFRMSLRFATENILNMSIRNIEFTKY